MRARELHDNLGVGWCVFICTQHYTQHSTHSRSLFNSLNYHFLLYYYVSQISISVLYLPVCSTLFPSISLLHSHPPSHTQFLILSLSNRHYIYLSLSLYLSVKPPILLISLPLSHSLTIQLSLFPLFFLPLILTIKMWPATRNRSPEAP